MDNISLKLYNDRMKRGAAFKALKEAVYSKLYFLGLGAFCLIIIMAVGRGYWQKREVDQDIVRLKSEINGIESSNKDLSQLLEYLKSDDFVVQEAKLKLGMQKPSEHLVVINDLNQGRPNLAASLPEAKLSNPQKWLRYFFQN